MEDRVQEFLEFAKKEVPHITFEKMEVPIQPAGIDLEKGTIFEPEFILVAHTQYFNNDKNLFKNILDFFNSQGDDYFGIYRIMPDKSDDSQVVLRWSPFFLYKDVDTIKEVVENEIY